MQEGMVEETEAEHLKVRAGMYIDCTQREERKKVFANLKETIGRAIEIKASHITLPIDKFEEIEAVMEWQEERIDIMEEGRDSG